MRFLVKARLKAEKQKELLKSIQNRTLGAGSVAGDEYLRNMNEARIGADGVVRWVETCFCATPLEEERVYWEPYFDLLQVKDAHARKNCRHENGSETWACCNCDCTRRLETKLKVSGKHFLSSLQGNSHDKG